MDGNEKRKTRTYTAEFKASAVKLALESSQPMSQTARDLGISKDTLYSWVSTARDLAAPVTETGASGPLYDELKRLRREVVVLREERDILKKAAAYFAKSVT